MTWTYDAAGRPAGMAVDGKTMTALTRDLRRRTVTITDTSDPARAEPVEHVLEWNSRGQMVRRARDGRAVTWSYDADGRRTAMTTPDGTRTDYRYDAAGWLAGIDSTSLGRAAFAVQDLRRSATWLRRRPGSDGALSAAELAGTAVGSVV